MHPTRVIRVVAVDDQPIYLAGIRHLLSSLPDIVVAGEAGGAADALALVERIRPDVLLLSGAVTGALTLVSHLSERHRALRVVILAERIEAGVLDLALRAGVAGYLLKHVAGFDLAQAIRSAASGMLTMAPEAAAVAQRSRRSESAADELSEREYAVLQLLVRGLSNDAIADRLCVSRSTVKFHLSNIYTKLGVRSRAEAIAAIYRRPAEPSARARKLAEQPLLLATAGD